LTKHHRRRKTPRAASGRKPYRRPSVSCPAKQRLAIVLRYYEGLSGREIAAAMQTSVKAVERLLARGRAGLEPRLAGFFHE
jgi:DNA-directed RNA polymerase specialized sigma24 family protein